MQGQDKGLIPFKGQPLIAHVVARISPQVGNIVISANRNPEAYQELGYKVIPDQRAGYQGPLAGLEACAPYCKTRYTLIASCDTPTLPTNLVGALLATLKERGCKASFAEEGDRQHYLCALVETHALSTITDYLNSNQRSVRGWLSLLGAQATPFAVSDAAFLNINNKKDPSI